MTSILAAADPMARAFAARTTAFALSATGAGGARIPRP